ncbi:MAG: PhoU domain-containing protein, partial [Clostridia bacterium]
ARRSSDVIVFSPTVIPEIQHMQQLINELGVMSLECFENTKKKMLKDIDAKEDEVDAEKRFLVADHIRRLNEGECQPSSSSVFINLIGNMERIADHLTYIAHSVEKKKMD